MTLSFRLETSPDNLQDICMIVLERDQEKSRLTLDSKSAAALGRSLITMAFRRGWCSYASTLEVPKE